MAKGYWNKLRIPYKRKRKFKSTALVIAKRALRKVNKVAKTVFDELKKNDTAILSQSVLPAGLVTNIVGISQGTGTSQRIGNSCVVKGVGLHGKIELSPLNSKSLVRLIMFIDKQQVPDSKTDTAAILATLTPFSYRDLQSRGRFTVIWDKYFTVHSNRVIISFRMWKRLNLNQKYNGLSSTDIQKNGIYLCSITDQVADFPVLTYICRFSFTP